MTEVKNRTVDKAMARVAEKYGVTVDELAKVLEGKQPAVPTFSAEVVETEKYGTMLYVKSSLVKPFYLSRKKCHSVMQVIDKVKAFANGK